MSSPWSDLDRPPLRETALRHALVRPDTLWTALDVVAETGSTNADLVARAMAGAPHGTVLTAESQTAGRGRLGRTWVAPPRSGLAVSVLVRPGGADGSGVPVPLDRWGWLPLLVGAAARAALADMTELDIALKWPNDLIVVGADGDGDDDDEAAGYGGRKLGGILAQRVDDGVVVGLGVNVSSRRDELPTPQATSLALEGASVTDREPLLRALLRRVDEVYRDWAAAGGDAESCGLRDDYTAHCATVGRSVRVSLPDGAVVAGTATGVDAQGALLLVINTAGEPDAAAQPAIVTVTAGDVVHVR